MCMQWAMHGGGGGGGGGGGTSCICVYSLPETNLSSFC